MSGAKQYDPLTARAMPPLLQWPDRTCLGVDLDVFYPRSGGNSDKAKEICRRCPHRRDCLSWAIDTGQGHGVWGGLTADERAALSRDAS